MSDSETDTQDESLQAITGIGPDYADRLREAGYETRDDVSEATPADLEQIEGIGPERASQISGSAEIVDDPNEDAAAESSSPDATATATATVDAESGDNLDIQTPKAKTFDAQTSDDDGDDDGSGSTEDATQYAIIRCHYEYVAPGLWIDKPGTQVTVELTTPVVDAIENGRATIVREVDPSEIE
jgi:hypothetical protein